MMNESTNVVSVSKNQQQRRIEIKVYKRRWLMLGLFTFNGTIVAGQWLQYAIISNIISSYYNVSSSMVDWTSMVYMLFYVVFIIPLTYLSEMVGLRWSLLITSGLAGLGSWIKVIAASPDRFYTSLLGQSIISIAAIKDRKVTVKIRMLFYQKISIKTTNEVKTMASPLPGRISAQWFASDELSTATSISFLGPQLGDCLTLLLTPMLIKNHENIDEIGPELYRLFLIVAIAASVNFILITMFFQNEPKLPPTETRALQKINNEGKNEGYMEPLKRIFTNKSFLILFNSYGINVGILNAFATLLNQLFLIHFKDGGEDVGRIGLIMIVAGSIGSIAFGLVLDKTREFKKTIVSAYFFTFCGQILFAISLLMGVLWMVYASVIVVGIFLYGFPMLGYELSIEYTYPESEVHSAGILNVSTSIYGMVLILVLQSVLERYGDVAVHVILCLVLFAGFVMTVLTKDEQRRQDARKAAQHKNVPLNEVRENGVTGNVNI